MAAVIFNARAPIRLPDLALGTHDILKFATSGATQVAWSDQRGIRSIVLRSTSGALARKLVDLADGCAGSIKSFSPVVDSGTLPQFEVVQQLRDLGILFAYQRVVFTTPIEDQVGMAWYDPVTLARLSPASPLTRNFCLGFPSLNPTTQSLTDLPLPPFTAVSGWAWSVDIAAFREGGELKALIAVNARKPITSAGTTWINVCDKDGNVRLVAKIPDVDAVRKKVCIVTEPGTYRHAVIRVTELSGGFADVLWNPYQIDLQHIIAAYKVVGYGPWHNVDFSTTLNNCPIYSSPNIQHTGRNGGDYRVLYDFDLLLKPFSATSPILIWKSNMSVFIRIPVSAEIDDCAGGVVTVTNTPGTVWCNPTAFVSDGHNFGYIHRHVGQGAVGEDVYAMYLASEDDGYQLTEITANYGLSQGNVRSVAKILLDRANAARYGSGPRTRGTIRARST
ncbi:MAG: hypothetical protein ACREVA_03515 [Burkholderiales bacterium]